MDTAWDMLSSTASVEAHQTERRSLTKNGTGLRHPIPLRNFSLRTLVAPYKSTQHTLFLYQAAKWRLHHTKLCAFTIPSLTTQWTTIPTPYQAQRNTPTNTRQSTTHRHTTCLPRTIRLSRKERSMLHTRPLPKPSHRTTPPTQHPPRTTTTNPAK